MNNNMKKVVVFGATGTIGAYATMELKKAGYEVIAIGRRRSDNGFFAWILRKRSHVYRYPKKCTPLFTWQERSLLECKVIFHKNILIL